MTEWETLIGLSYGGGQSVHDKLYQFDPKACSLTVTRLGRPRGRLLV